MVDRHTDDTTRILGPDGDVLDTRALDGDGLPLGSRVGPYLIIAELGGGGMGRVYLAEQLEPVRREVALKTGHAPAPGFDAEGFLHEHQVLAQMNHPGIAKVFDAGTLDDGRPWLVMECIRGRPIDAYCAEHRLPLRTRIQLMIDVCRSIEHAHQRLLLHLDLKPSNILVTEIDGHPVARVIDFGSARIRGARGSLQAITGSLGYMAPEQIEFGSLLDSRADVFSLGVILYELLTNRRFRVLDIGEDAQLAELKVELLREIEPALTHDFVESLPQRRRRELERIVRRATNAHRDGRYGSAGELATDLEHWLDHRPVSAMVGTVGYRVRCLLARHAVPFALGALLLIVLVAGLAGTGMGLLKAREQRQIAERRQADLEQTVRFQQQVLAQIDVNALADLMVSRLAENARNLSLREGRTEEAAQQRRREIEAELLALAPVDAARDLLVEGVLGQAAALIDSEYARDDRVEAALRVSLGETLTRWQAFSRAEVQIGRARSIYAAEGNPSDLDALRAEVEAVKLAWWQQQFERAHQIASDNRPRAEATLGSDHELTLYLLRAEAVMAGKLGDLEGSVRMFERLLERMRERKGENDPDTLQIEGDFLFALRQANAGHCSRELWARYEAHLARTARLEGAAARTHAISSMNLAGCAQIEGDYDRAAELYGQAAETARLVLGERHMITVMALNDWAWSLLEAGQPDEVEAMLESLETNQRLVYGDASYMNLYPRSYRLQIEMMRGNSESALKAAVELIEEAESHPGTPPDFVALLWSLRAGAEDSLGRMDEARYSADRALASCWKAAGASRHSCLGERIAVAWYDSRTGRTPRPELLDELREDVADRRLEDPARTVVAWLRLGLADSAEERERLRRSELNWLLDADPDSLHPQQRLIRNELVRVMAGVNARP